MHRSKYPPGNSRRNLENTSTSIPLAAVLAVIALNIINVLAGAARNLAQAIVPEPSPRLALAGSPPMRGRSLTMPKSDQSMLMIGSMHAGRSDRRGSTRHAAGQFGGGGIPA